MNKVIPHEPATLEGEYTELTDVDRMIVEARFDPWRDLGPQKTHWGDDPRISRGCFPELVASPAVNIRSCQDRSPKQWLRGRLAHLTPEDDRESVLKAIRAEIEKIQWMDRMD